ncbi:MAG TPA: hypothetical protein VD996_09230 [Chitinophagaceae bacterium]|nr:hypothetical protein [Chitinophagaceae bacterium]
MKNFAVIALILASCQCLAQPSAVIESNRKGLEILRKSLAAYGGVAATDSLKLAFKMNASKAIMRGQSLVPAAPFEPYYSYSNYMVDRPGSIEIEQRKSAIAGDFVFESTTFYQNGKGISYDPLMKQYYEVTGNGTSGSMTYLPQNAVSAALRNPVSVRYMQETQVNNEAAYLLTYIVGSALDHLYIDKKTNRVVKLQRLYPSGTGEELHEFYYRKYQKAGDILFPLEAELLVHNPVYGTVSNTYTFTDLRTEFAIDPSMLAIPEGYAKQDYSYRKKFEVRELAKDIYLLENITSSNYQWSYNVLFAVMDEFVLVAEAPMNSAMTERVLAKIKEVAPGKPVKYLVQSHHHDDHLGGIRGYIAEGATIISTPGNAGLIQKIAKVEYHAFPDRLAKHPKPAVIETLQQKKRVIKDQRHEVVIMDVGPNPHANEMIIVYFPNEKLIYQCDLINKGEYPLGAPGIDFLKKIKSMGLQVDRIASLHGQTVEKEEIAAMMSKAVSQ